MEVGQAVETCCCRVREERGGVVGAPCFRVQEGGVRGVEAGEVGGRREVASELVRGAVNGCGELCKVEHIQGAS